MAPANSREDGKIDLTFSLQTWIGLWCCALLPVIAILVGNVIVRDAVHGVERDVLVVREGVERGAEVRTELKKQIDMLITTAREGHVTRAQILREISNLQKRLDALDREGGE